MTIAAALLVVTGGFAAIRPSNDRDWVAEQRVMPVVTFIGDTLVRVEHVRNFDWTPHTDGNAHPTAHLNGDPTAHPNGDPRPAYYDRIYDLRRVASVSYIVTPFSKGWRGPAHTFVSFGFDDSTYVGVSVEARKEVGETYSIAKGFLKRFEVMFVIGDEHDLIPLRANKWGDEIEVYPVKATRAQAREMFVGMMTRAHALETKPEFYGSIRNNCTTNILDQANRIAPKKIRYGWRVLLPGYSDELAMNLGLLDTALPLAQARARFRVNDRSGKYLNDPKYSVRIREEDAAK